MEYIAVAYRIVLNCVRPSMMKEKVYIIYISQVKEEYANILMHNQRYEESATIRKQLLEEAIVRWGENRFSTLAAKQNYYSVLIHLNYEDGIKGMKRVLHKRETIILRSKQDIEQNEVYKIYALQQIAVGLCIIKNYVEALDFAEKAYTKAFELFGQEDIRTQSILHNVNSILLELHAYDEVVDLLENMYIKWVKMLPNDSELILTMRLVMGIAYGECGKTSEGKKLLMDNFQFAYDRFGVCDKHTLLYKKEYALCVANGGEHEEAIELLKDCKEKYERVYGNDGSDQLKNILISLITEYHITKNSSLEKEEQEHFFNMCSSVEEKI